MIPKVFQSKGAEAFDPDCDSLILASSRPSGWLGARGRSRFAWPERGRVRHASASNYPFRGNARRIPDYKASTVRALDSSAVRAISSLNGSERAQSKRAESGALRHPAERPSIVAPRSNAWPSRTRRRVRV